jgi:hypothetical protein
MMARNRTANPIGFHSLVVIIYPSRRPYLDPIIPIPPVPQGDLACEVFRKKLPGHLLGYFTHPLFFKGVDGGVSTPSCKQSTCCVVFGKHVDFVTVDQPFLREGQLVGGLEDRVPTIPQSLFNGGISRPQCLFVSATQHFTDDNGLCPSQNGSEPPQNLGFEALHIYFDDGWILDVRTDLPGEGVR